MIKFFNTFLFTLTSVIALGQSIDEVFSAKKMKKDLEVFKEIRQKANSGLYKYRTKEQIDGIYNWADREINTLSTYRDFYNLIATLTDYEGSLHNDTSFPKKYSQSFQQENSGYFPLPIKWIEDKWRINFEEGEIPLGSEIVSINDIPINEVISKLYKYYTTDGHNLTGKRIGIRTHFASYFRQHYGLQENFVVNYKKYNSEAIESNNLNSVGYTDYYKNFINRYSRPYDNLYYEDLKDNQKYHFKKIDSLTAILTIYSFAIGNETTERHKNYIAFLDSTFTKIKTDKIENLIVDVRLNGGGTDPNDIVTFSYLTNRNFQENKEAWISFDKIPLIRYYDISIPKFIRPMFVGKFNREFQGTFPLKENNRWYQDIHSEDHQIRVPNEKAFIGNVYLLISPAIASAGSLFAAMVAGNNNTITIGEETMGGYYGHNGHTSLDYKLPKSKIEIGFSIVNLEQDVPKKSNQIYERGILPDFDVSQTFDDFLKHEDTLLNFTLKMIRNK